VALVDSRSVVFCLDGEPLLLVPGLPGHCQPALEIKCPKRHLQTELSSGQRWLGAWNTILGAVAALALLIMVNYLAAGHYFRLLGSRTSSLKLSRQTLAVLDSLTNDVQVTIFFQPNGDNQEIYG